MRGEVIEVAATSDVGLYAPRHGIARRAVKLARWLSQADVYVDDLAHARDESQQQLKILLA